jgi:hypothetical protein
VLEAAAQAPTSELVSGLKAISTWASNWGVPLAAIGTISMALLQTAKNILPLRRRFQENRIAAWLVGRNKEHACRAETDLVALVTSGDRDAFYNSDIDQICTQIKSALTAVLDYPELHKDLVQCLASTAEKDDVCKLFHLPHADIFLKAATQSTPQERQAIREYAIAKTRVGAEMRSTVDAIQNSISFRWKRRLQIISVFLSAAIGVIALHVGASPGLVPTLGATLVIGLLSGFLAPVARDLLAAVGSWRSN